MKNIVAVNYAHSDQRSGEREYIAIPAKFIRTRYKNDVQPHVLSFCMSLSRHKFNSTNLTRLDSSIDNVTIIIPWNFYSISMRVKSNVTFVCTNSNSNYEHSTQLTSIYCTACWFFIVSETFRS